VEQCGHGRGRPGLGDSDRSGPQELRDQRLPATSPDPGRRAPLGVRRQEGQGRLHLVHGRPVHPGQLGTYVSTKHALEAIAEALQQELAPYGIKVQTVNPGAYYTGYNETMADNPFRWLDDSRHFTKRADLRKGFDDFFATPEGRMDPQEMIDRMIEIVPADTGKFRNVVPKKIEDMLKAHQLAAWNNQI
jgi:NAD(P)-dependent dehydrogenase (short-subunit alcohol dehydrogenase family)